MNPAIHTDGNPNLLEMRGIDKMFPGVHALRDVTLSVRRGEVLGLAGENGAGKSTLMKVLSGAYQIERGEIFFAGRLIAHPSPSEMLDHGIAVIYQELLLAPHLTVAENVFLGCLPRTRSGIVDWKQMNAQARDVLDRLGFAMDPTAVVGTLSVAQQQMVEIAKALSRDAKLFVLDEPSAVLGESEIEKLFGVIRRLAAEGVSFIYISHRLAEIFEIADRIVVMRDGCVVGEVTARNVTTDELVRMMVGREIGNLFPQRQRKPGPVALSVRGLTRRGAIDDVSFDLREGQIVGICGLAGAGRSEVLRAILGADHIDKGEVYVRGEKVTFTSPASAIRSGVGLLPEDRKTQGMFLPQSVGFNVTISRLESLLRHGILSESAERATVKQYMHDLHIKAPTPESRIADLSGGNQQKCILAKMLHARCHVLLVDEPTRGVDVAAKCEIYQILADLADRERSAIVMVSSELPEVLGLADWVLVMCQGRLAAEFSHEEATEEKVMRYATQSA